MTYRLSGAAAFPGFDKGFLSQFETALHAALPDSGFLEVLGLGRGAIRPLAAARHTQACALQLLRQPSAACALGWGRGIAPIGPAHDQHVVARLHLGRNHSPQGFRFKLGRLCARGINVCGRHPRFTQGLAGAGAG